MRGLGIVERDDECSVAVREAAVPLVVVARVADAEAAAVDGEEGREDGWRGLVVGLGEKDARGDVWLVCGGMGIFGRQGGGTGRASMAGPRSA